MCSVEPPILVGDAVYLIKVESGYQISFLYSIPLVEMLSHHWLVVSCAVQNNSYFNAKEVFVTSISLPK